MSSVRLIAITKPVITECTEPGDLIAYCARVSNPANQHNTETAPKLLAYLKKNAHWSPFEMASMTLEIVTTRDIGRQILRHRSFSFQEWSGRYAVMPEDFVHSEARLQDTKNRQNSIQLDDAQLKEWWDYSQNAVAGYARGIYQAALKRGIAKEVARKVLPEGLTPSTMYMAGTIRSWMHYCEERTKPGVQKEHRLIAEQCRAILHEQFPALKEQT